MDYEIAIGGASRKVSLATRGRAADQFEVHLGSERRPLIVRVLQHEPPTSVVAIGQRIYSVRLLRRTPTAVEFLLNGERVVAERASARTAPPTGGSGVATVAEEVTAHYPAKVVRVPVMKGARVKAGETILVLEAMKMETYLEAPRDCTVAAIYVREGDMIARGARLAHLDFDPDSAADATGGGPAKPGDRPAPSDRADP